MWDKSVVSPILVGRAQNVEQLHQLLEQTAKGTGAIALIEGEAGIGKSRLVAETLRRAETLGSVIFKGNAFESDRALPYAPLTDLLRDYLAAHPSAVIPPEFVPILPELPALAPTPALDPAQDKRRLFTALSGFFFKQAVPSALIVIEDLHWCDESTLEFVLAFARRLSRYPILLLVTLRPDETNPALERLLAEFDRTRLAAELRLDRLDRKETDTMLRAIFGLNRPVQADFLNVLYQLTEGNPFFIEEVLKSLIAAGDIFYAEGAWDRKPIEELKIPRSVQDAVHRRAEKPSERARATLAYAAVAGRRFDFRLLLALTQMSESELTQVIKELAAAALVVEESAEVFAFRHALTREAIYSTLLLRERKQYHRQIAETIELLYPAARETRLSELAYHYYRAEDWANAFLFGERAGRQAQALYAPREAVEQFTRAIESAKQLGGPPSPPLLLARGSAHEMLGSFERARADFDAALEGARAVQDREAEWGTLIELGKLWTSRDYARSSEYYAAALALARQMAHPGKIASSLNRIGNWNSNLDQPQAAMDAHAEALQNFIQLHDPRGIAETSDLLAMAHWIGGDLDAATEHYTRAVKLFRELNDRQGLVSSLSTLALRAGQYKTETLVLPLRRLSDANADGEEAIALAREIESRAGEAYALWCLGAAAASQGDYGRALALTQESLAAAEEIAHQQWQTAANCILGGIHLDLLALEPAVNHLERAVALANSIGSQHWVRIASSRLAMALIVQKDFARAGSVLDAANPRNGVDPATMDSAMDSAMNSVGKRQCWLARAELALARGDGAAAQKIAEQLIDSACTAGNAVIPSQLIGRKAIIPRLWKLRGDALAAQGSMEAESVLREGMSAASGQGALPLLWQMHVSLGKLSQDEAAFGAARGIVLEIAATVADLSLRENFITGANESIPAGRAPTARQIAKNEFGGLTAREREIAAMIARGQSNREIAAGLVVSERTVETHVGNVLAKLGMHSRAQIAAWAVEKRIVRDEG